MSHKSLILLTVVFLFSMVAYAQESASIIGTVEDTTGGVMPGAAVTATNLDTGRSREVITDDEGRYRAANLPLGAYEVRAELPGFSTAVRRGLSLTVGSELIVNLTLSVGEVTEEVLVTAEGALVETTNTVLSGLVDSDQIADLPLNGRNFTGLALLQKGVLLSTTAGSGTSRGNGLKVSISGSRQTQVTYTLDGSDINDNFGQLGSVSGASLGVDAIREFRVVTSPFSSEYARASGGEVQIVTKSGTNQFHGGLFEFHRNSALDANSWEDNKRGLDKPPFTRHQFGASAGGPIIADKTFFFANYEGLREGLTTGRDDDVPTQAVHDGFFEGVDLGVDAEIAPFLEQYPLPNDPAKLDLGDGTGSFIWSGQRATTEDYILGRIDHQLSDSHSFYARYVFDDGERTDPNNFGKGEIFSDSRAQYFSMALTSVFTPTFVHEIQLSFNRSRLSEAEFARDDAFGSLFSFTQDQIPPNLLGISDPGEGEGIGTSDGRPETFIYNVFQIRDNMSWQRGAHSLKFGTNIEYFQDNNNNEFHRAPGEYEFGDLGDFLQGLPSNYITSFPGFSPIRTVTNYLFGFYLQDDWAVRPRLKLNLGVRYEPMTVHTERYGRISGLRTPLDPTADLDDIVVGDPLYQNPSKGNFGPRLGFAWDLTGDGKTALRGGAGLFFDHIQHLFIRVAFDRNAPFMIWGDLDNDDAQDIFGVDIDFPNAFATQPFIFDLELSPIDVALETIQFDIEQAKKINYALNLQRDLGIGGLVLDVGYSGSKGADIVCVVDINQRVPIVSDGTFVTPAGTLLSEGTLYWPKNHPTEKQPGGIQDAPKFNENTGDRIRRRVSACDSWYNAGLFGLRRRSQGGLGFQISYTVSKSIDTGSNGSGSSDFANGESNPIIATPPGFLFRNDIDKGLSAFDVRQNLSFNWSYRPQVQLSGWANHIFGNWAINGIVRMSSGPPFSVFGSDTNNERRTSGVRSNTPPNLAPGTTELVIDPQNPDLYYDPALFEIPEQGLAGHVGRNVMIAPGLVTADFSLLKDWPVPQFGEQGSVQFRVEFFNLANRPNFDLPEDTLFNRDGTDNKDAGTIEDNVTTSRQIQLGLRINF